MKSLYPFDLYDWKTTTALLQTLIDAQVINDGFMIWLEQWNQLDIAIWDACTTLKRPAHYDTHEHTAEQVYTAYAQKCFRPI